MILKEKCEHDESENHTFNLLGQSEGSFRVKTGLAPEAGEVTARTGGTV